MKTLDAVTNIMSNLDKAMYIVDKNRKMLFFNMAAETLTGYKAKDVIGEKCFDSSLNPVDKDGNIMSLDTCLLIDPKFGNTTFETNVYLQHKKGFRFPVTIKSIPYLEDNVVVGAVEVINDKTKRKPSIDKRKYVQKLNMTDSLTQTLNRNFLDIKLEKSLEPNKSYGLLFIDLDDFKQINDKHGHLVGDSVLEVVSKTLLYNTTSDEYVIRFGGEEFVIIIEAKDIKEAEYKANNLRVIINSSYIESIDYYPSVSVGVTMLNKYKDIDYSINKADIAMYAAKNSGKNKIFVDDKL